MRVLFIWDTAGVSSILAKEMRKQNIEAKVLMQNFRGTQRLIDITGYYGNDILDISKHKFAYLCLRAMRNYDVIHISALWKLLPLARLLYPNKRIYFHAHGTDVRNRDNGLRQTYKNLGLMEMDAVFYATKDLCDYIPNIDKVYIPTPIDTDHFKPVSRCGNCALTFTTEYLDAEQAEDLFHTKYNMPLFTRDRDIQPTLYKDLPELFSSYSTYSDIKFMKGTKQPLQASSKTGLEFLATGGQIVDYKLDIIDKLDDIHFAKNVVSEVISQYVR